ENRLRRTVIPLEPHDLRTAELRLKVQDVPDIRPPERIDALIVITHHRDVSVRLRQQAQQKELDGVGVLILVHHDLPKPLPILIEDLRTALEELHWFHEKVVEVERVL